MPSAPARGARRSFPLWRRASRARASSSWQARPWKPAQQASHHPTRQVYGRNYRQQAGCKKTKIDLLTLTCRKWSSRCFRSSQHHNKTRLRHSQVVAQAQPTSHAVALFLDLWKIPVPSSCFCLRCIKFSPVQMFFSFSQGPVFSGSNSLILMVFKDRGLPHWLRQLRRCFGELGLVFGWVLGWEKLPFFWWRSKNALAILRDFPCLLIVHCLSWWYNDPCFMVEMVAIYKMEKRLFNGSVVSKRLLNTPFQNGKVVYNFRVIQTGTTKIPIDRF